MATPRRKGGFAVSILPRRCAASHTEALYPGQSFRPDVAARCSKVLRGDTMPSRRMPPMAAEHEDLWSVTNDPVARLLLSGRAQTLREAEELYLDACLPEVIRLLQGPLSDEELGRLPLMAMLRSHGSRAWEEALD